MKKLSDHRVGSISTKLSHFPIYHQKSTSVLAKNRLTKSYFSLSDTSLNHKVSVRPHIKEAARSLSKPKFANSKYLQRFTTSIENKKPSASFQEFTHSSIPRVSSKRHPEIESERRTRSELKIKTQSMKFKLLFRDKNARKTVEERKIDRLDRKINNLKMHQKYIQKFVPQTQPPVVVERVEPKGTIVKGQIIDKLLHNLIHNIELYFNMYESANRVGDLIKSLEGFNEKIRTILFDGSKAKRIKRTEQLRKYFWVFKESRQRPQYYGQEDLNLYNILQNFCLKMEKGFGDIEKNYISNQSKRLQATQKSIAKQLSVYQKKFEPHPEISSINQFITYRNRHNQERREDSMSKLESLGVRFKVEERSRELVIRGREKVMSNFNINKYMI